MHATGMLRGRHFEFETILHNFTSISTISPNFLTIPLVVTENSSKLNLARKKKNKKWSKNKVFPLGFGDFKIRKGAKTISLPTSFGILNYIIIAPDKAAYCVFTQSPGPENAIKFISVRTKTQ